MYIIIASSHGPKHNGSDDAVARDKLSRSESVQ